MGPGSTTHEDEVTNPGATPALLCSIPSDGANAPRPLASAGGLPVVLRGEPSRERHLEAFGCKVRKANPVTPDRVTPDVRFRLAVHSGASVTMPDGKAVRFWGFEGGGSRARKPFPSPTLRVREGQVVHTTLEASKSTHTIHHHGIEPLPHNDGAGHTSFEVDDRYTYQWRASSAGTYFYHCHKNTVLHFELGMYGSLIVDPPQGPGFVRRGTDVIRYDREVVWIPDDVDPRWHDPHMDHSAGLRCPVDRSQHLLRFEPTYFLLTGVPSPRSRTDSRVALRCRRGERIVLRLLNAAYGPVDLRLPFDAEVISLDGRVLGGPGPDRYSRPWTVPAGQVHELTTAQRRDVLIAPDRLGTFTVPMEVRHWVTGRTQGTIETTITVT